MRSGGWSLRARLLAELLALLAVVCLIIGVFTGLALRDLLVDQVDDRLVSTRERLGPPPRGGQDEPRQPPDQDGRQPPPPRPLEGPGIQVGTLIMDRRRAEFLDGSATGRPIPTEDERRLRELPADDRPRTLDLTLGEYRVVATISPEGDKVVTGLPMSDVNATMFRFGLIMAGVAIGGLVLTGAAGTVIVRVTLRPLRRVADTASRVAELPLDRGDVALSVRVPDEDSNPRTEVGKVGNALNRMLGHVDAALAARQASETRVRQFVADASHELRTPLAAIRGYAELTRRSGEDVPPDVAHAIHRVESESTRMTALVNDLLLLARLDSAAAGRPMVTGPVDLSRMVVDAASDAHVAGPQHRWQLYLPAESVVVTGDEAQLHHVVGNLLTNARTHTPPGTTVDIGLSTEDEHAMLTVTDDGPGIPPELQPDVFDRFARGDTSRSRAAGSTGLGLAIVAAVVQAHSGTVDVQSRPGRTTFSVRLPLA